MQRNVTTESPQALSDSQKAALINLLSDDDLAVYQAVRGKILSYGAATSDWLRPHTLSGDPLLRRRSHEIIQHFARHSADDRFLSFCLKQGEDLNLEHGAWLLAQTQYPDTNLEAYQALLDSFANELRARIASHSEATPLLNAINQYLFEELGFHGNENDYYDPDNSYLNRVIDRRTGNPINLSLVYLLLARRLSLPIAGIGLPGHFVCRYQSTSEEVYIDVFHRGQLLTKADCVQYLVQANLDFEDAHLTPSTNRRILYRICVNLHQIYVQLEIAEEATRLQRYLVALNR